MRKSIKKMLGLKRERRRHKRTSVELVINCYLPVLGTDDKDKFESHAVDISPKGIRLITSRKVKVGDEILLLLKEPLTRSPLLIKGKARWIKEEFSIQREAVTQIGIEFLHICSFNENERHKLDILIKEIETSNRLNREH